ncbi:peptidylprolyl isomerase [Marinagarivorans algicola]|uniref:peptidylprolyl isomerase n=1 Tax=Marinagarivorans algicola TaxID=1513270 RepID=UPI0006B67E68|nr:peptidylprolyl isomerase [Marinagarivorans algicola]
MKNPLSYLAASLAFSASVTFSSLVPSAAAEPQLLDSIAAIVDNQIILQSTLNERITAIAANAARSKMALPEASVLQEQVLEHLIVEQLQVQKARRYGVNIEDAQINATIKEMQQKNNLTDAQFTAQLALEGLTLSLLKERIERDMLIQNIQRGLVSQRITVSNLEIDNFLKSAEAQFWLSPEYHLGHILVALPQSATEAEIESAKAQAQSLYEQATKGAVFAELAIAYSKGPNALKGGDLGFRKTSDLPSLFAEIAPTLSIGGVSKPSRSAAGFHLIKLYEKRGEDTQVVKQFKARHILVKPSAILTDEEAEQKLITIRQQIIDGADFAALAKEHSEDIGSMLAGGDLGWSNPGQFVPEFEAAMTQTPTGEISAPFRSQFGWHILQVQEQRDEDMTQAVIRNKARNILTNRRFEDELQVWLRELRDEAFVEIKTAS